MKPNVDWDEAMPELLVTSKVMFDGLGYSR